MANVRVLSNPTNATVVLSGSNIDPETRTTPWTFTALEIGETHTFTVSKEGYITESATFEIDREEETIGFTLEEGSGDPPNAPDEYHRLRVTSEPTGAYVHIEFEDEVGIIHQGITPVTFNLIEGLGYFVSVGKNCYMEMTIHYIPWNDESINFVLTKAATTSTSSMQGTTSTRYTSGTKTTTGTQGTAGTLR